MVVYVVRSYRSHRYGYDRAFLRGKPKAQKVYRCLSYGLSVFCVGICAGCLHVLRGKWVGLCLVEMVVVRMGESEGGGKGGGGRGIASPRRANDNKL